MKQKDSGSVSDMGLSGLEGSGNSLDNYADLTITVAPFITSPNSSKRSLRTEPQKTLYSTAATNNLETTAVSIDSSFTHLDSASHDKSYYDDRYNQSSFDPKLAVSALPKMLISIGGMLFVGFFLNIIMSWNVFTHVPELFVLVPVMTNLRNILEQNLSSRIAAASTFGIMDSNTGSRKIWVGNINLVMFQSITSGILAGLMCSGLSILLVDSKLPIWRAILMVVVAASTSATASVLSGLFLFFILNVFKRVKQRPEELVGPLTTSFGSLMALIVLAVQASFFYLWMGNWIGILMVVMSLVSANIYFYSRVRKSEVVMDLASEGWSTILLSLIVTGASGLLWQHFISEYRHIFALFLPIFTGVTGNIAGIYASEATSHLHLFQLNPLLPRKTALTLILISNPIQTILVLLISFTNSHYLNTTLLFIVTYLIFGNMQTLLLIALADLLIKVTWRLRAKPEAHVPALLSTLGDFGGTLLLAAAFFFLKKMNQLPSPHLVSSPLEDLAKIVKNSEEFKESIQNMMPEQLTSLIETATKD